MNKPLTPMSRCKSNFAAFREEIKNVFNEVSLNQSRSKSYYSWGDGVCENKGVKSDFLIIFKNNNTNISFSFVFTYKNIKDEDAFVVCQIKKGKENENMVSSEIIKVTDFNKKLAQITAKIKERPFIQNQTKDAYQIVNLIKETFNIDDLSLGKSIKSLLDEASQKEANLSVKKEKLLKINKEKDEKLKLIDKEVAYLEEFKEIENLEEKIAELTKKLNERKDFVKEFTNKKIEELGLKSLANEERNLKKEIEGDLLFLGLAEKESQVLSSRRKYKR